MKKNLGMEGLNEVNSPHPHTKVLLQVCDCMCLWLVSLQIRYPPYTEGKLKWLYRLLKKPLPGPGLMQRMMLPLLVVAISAVVLKPTLLADLFGSKTQR